jgi:hypothetical protein
VIFVKRQPSSPVGVFQPAGALDSSLATRRLLGIPTCWPVKMIGGVKLYWTRGRMGSGRRGNDFQPFGKRRQVAKQARSTAAVGSVHGSSSKDFLIPRGRAFTYRAKLSAVPLYGKPSQPRPRGASRAAVGPFVHGGVSSGRTGHATGVARLNQGPARPLFLSAEQHQSLRAKGALRAFVGGYSSGGSASLSSATSSTGQTCQRGT